MSDSPTSALAAAVRPGDNVLIAMHREPDGDAAGSALGLREIVLAARPGCRVEVFSSTPLAGPFLFLPGADGVIGRLPELEWDLLVLVDCGSRERVERGFAPRARRTAYIDHHTETDGLADIILHDPAASSAAVLVHRFARAAGLPLTAGAAVCLLCGILSDTGFFTHANSDAESLSIAAGLVSLGADPSAIAGRLRRDRPVGKIRLLSEVLATLAVGLAGRLASVRIDAGMERRSGVGYDQSDEFINYPASIRGVEVAVQVRELAPGRFKVGFRSTGGVDVAALAAIFGGGGHRKAAGCTIESGSAEAVLDLLAASIEPLLPHAQRSHSG